VSVPAAAVADAAAAARRSGVTIAPLSEPDELDRLRATMDAIWGPAIVPPRNLLRGLALGGAGLLLASRDDRPVGFALGWLGWDEGLHFHSHQVGVIADERASGVGLALKLAQRAECLAHGITEMRWTFDPVLRSNARFNLLRLGARIVTFRPHCYGDRVDAFNTGDVTDRVEVSWRLDQPIGGRPPTPHPDDVLVPLPADYHALRRSDPDAADHVRHTVGAHLADAVATGRVVRGLHDDGTTTAYVIGRTMHEGETP
jgi:predicted GNAT superfamily acetyltransferase